MKILLMVVIYIVSCLMMFVVWCVVFLICLVVFFKLKLNWIEVVKCLDFFLNIVISIWEGLIVFVV